MKIMKMRTVCFGVGAVLCGFVLYQAATGQLRRVQASLLKSDPLVEYPSRIDLGQHEMGDQAIARFTIANRGGAELVLDSIRTNCSCTGMEREEGNGRFERLESLRLKRGEEASLVMRISVPGIRLGGDMLTFVDFRTNDPIRPTGRIEAIVRRVSGGVVTLPQSVVFGKVPVGSKVRRLVEVRDPASPARSIVKVASNDPERVGAKILDGQEEGADTESPIKGAPIGQVEIVVDTQQPGPVSTNVLIYITGRDQKPDTVAVVGTVAAPFEVSPSLIVFPRASPSGPVYTCSCVCRSPSGKPLDLAVNSVPGGVDAELLEGQGPGERAIRIVLDPNRFDASTNGKRPSVRLLAKDGDNEAVLELPILLRK
jgi:hypothetical protein